MPFKTLFKIIYNSADKLEDKVRGRLSHYPIVYAFIGGTGIVIFWRGIWLTVDSLMALLSSSSDHATSLGSSAHLWWDGPLSILVGTVLLLTVGLFVTTLIGNEIIISGLKREKKIVEKTEEELNRDLREKSDVKAEIHDIDSRIRRIEESLTKRP